MTWQELALRAHDERPMPGRAEAERLLGQWAFDLGMQGTAEVIVEGNWLYMPLPNDPPHRPVRLGVRIDAMFADDGPRAVHAFMQPRHPLGSGHERDWVDCGYPNSIRDLGALLLNGPPETPPAPPASEGDLLLQVLKALVREVVHEEFDGRLGDGPP